jgi:hypothetical protein
MAATLGPAWWPEMGIPIRRGRPGLASLMPSASGRADRRRGWARLGGATCAAILLVAMTAVPADAHLLGTNAAPTNYRTQILAVSPPIQGLQVRVAEIGGTLELLNRTGRQVIVLGARFEPYLRVEAGGGVEENRRSPTWLASRPPGSPASRSGRVDPTAPPDWHRIGGGLRVVWHDHRSHWTGPDPPQVRQAPHRRQVVIPRWQVPLRVGGQTAVVTGEVVWVPGSSPWPWLGLAAALAATVAAAARRWRGVLVAALLVAVASDLVHTVGGQLASVAPIVARVYASSLAAVGWVLGVVVASRLLRRRSSELDLYLLLAAGMFFAFAGGLADVTVLGRSQVSTALPVGVARAAVAVSLGLGVGIFAVAVRRTLVGSLHDPV